MNSKKNRVKFIILMFFFSSVYDILKLQEQLIMEPASSSTSLQMADISQRRKQLKTQQSTVTSRRQQAVCVRRAYKSYGPKKNANVVLDGLNMTVPKGCM